MTISLVLTSRDRVDDLRRFFDSLLKGEKNFGVDLVFINQGKYDPKSEFSFNDEILYTSKYVDPVPLSVSRNLGLESITGDIVGFPDDDCWYDQKLLKNVHSYFSENLEVDCLCTNVFDPIRSMTYGGRPVGMHCRVGFNNIFRLPISVGIFVRRAALERVGAYFDEMLGAGTQLGSGEETELISRMLEANLHVQYNGAIQVFHPVADYTDNDIEKFYKYGLGFGFLNRKLLNNGHLSVMPYFLSVLMRSVIGALVNISRPVKRGIYWKRLLGIVRGAFMVEGSRSGNN